MSFKLKHGERKHATVKAVKDFNPDKDAERLMEFLEDDLNDVIDLVSSRSSAQRIEIMSTYYQLCGMTLDHDIKRTTNSDFQKTLLALFTSPEEYDANFIRNSFKKVEAGDKVRGIVEILATRNEVDLERIKIFYELSFGETLEAAIHRETAGYLKNLLLQLLQGPTEENANNLSTSKTEAEVVQELHAALSYNARNAELTINKIFSAKDVNKLRSIFQQYKQTKKDISRAVAAKYSGSYKEALLTVIQITNDPPKYYAKLFYRSMKGLGTHDSALVRLVVTRCEIDMTLIKSAFKREYGKTLAKFIRGDTSGSYRKLLIALIDGN